MAVEANTSALNELKNREEAKAHHQKEEIDAANRIAAQLNGKTVCIQAKAGSGGKLFGSVTTKEIAAAIASSFGVEIDRKKMSAPDIKNFGEYEAEIKLHQGISAKITVKVTE